ncbi:MAG: SHOCT domain-containing protein [Halanaerobiaceae bacterium]
MLLNLFNTVLAQTGMFRGRLGHHFFRFGGGPFMIVLWILIIIGAVWLIKEVLSNKNKTGHYSQQNDNNYRNNSLNDQEKPEEIARKRLAKGEITKEEYQEIIEALKDN